MDDSTSSIPANLTEDDDRKVFVSRIPRNFSEDQLFQKFEEKFGANSVEVANVAYDEELEQGKGFGFVVFTTKQYKIAALKARTVKATKNSMYVRNVQREGREGRGRDKGGICFLWQSGNCTHGDHCRFKHEGHGSVDKTVTEKKAPKCFKFKKGKCQKGDACPFRHVGASKKNSDKCETATTVLKREDSEKPCFNWKKKGKCRKGDKCPFSHSIDLIKKKIKSTLSINEHSRHDNKKEKVKRKRDKYEKNINNDDTKNETNVRIFGLNYDTTKECVEKVFGKCGQIISIEFPTFEDSKRSKGFCQIEFKNVRGANKCIKMDGEELDGRWLRIQKGKMFKTWDKDNSIRKGIDEKEQNDTIFVGNLDFKWDEQSLFEVFEKRFGKVLTVKLSRGRKKSVNKGFCHVQFASMSSAIKAVKGDGSQIMGRRVQIDFASLKNEDDEEVDRNTTTKRQKLEE